MSNGIRLARAWLFALVLSLGAAPVCAEAPVERLGVPGPLLLDGQAFHLVWSSHPFPHFYKQEYLPDGQTLAGYDQLDFRVSGHTAGGQAIVEWNAYRYEALPGGAVMLGISRRGYGEEGARRFLINEVKPRRQAWILELAQLEMPRIALASP